MKIWDRIMCKIERSVVHDERLKYEDFPALFMAADTYSLAQQKLFFDVLFIELLLLVVATAISVLNLLWPSMAIVQAVALLGALACSVYLFAAKPDRLVRIGNKKSIHLPCWACNQSPHHIPRESRSST